MSKAKKRSGGFIIADDKTIILGKNEKDLYEGFGGGAEEQDLSSLHTSVRELIEEFFNVKVPVEVINSLSEQLNNRQFINKKLEYYGDSYLIDYSGLEFVFNFLSGDIKELNNYINPFVLNKYIIDRKVIGKPKNGLNEIVSLHIFNLEDVINNKVPLRWYTDKVIKALFQKK